MAAESLKDAGQRSFYLSEAAQAFVDQAVIYEKRGCPDQAREHTSRSSNCFLAQNIRQLGNALGLGLRKFG